MKSWSRNHELDGCFSTAWACLDNLDLRFGFRCSEQIPQIRFSILVRTFHSSSEQHMYTIKRLRNLNFFKSWENEGWNCINCVAILNHLTQFNCTAEEFKKSRSGSSDRSYHRGSKSRSRSRSRDRRSRSRSRSRDRRSRSRSRDREFIFNIFFGLFLKTFLHHAMFKLFWMVCDLGLMESILK